MKITGVSYFAKSAMFIVGIMYHFRSCFNLIFPMLTNHKVLLHFKCSSMLYRLLYIYAFSNQWYLCCSFSMDNSKIINLCGSKKTSMGGEITWARNANDFMDFKLQLQNDSLPCNKLVLATHSPYMKAMLTSGMTEVTKQEVKLKNIRVDIMNIILDYMYKCDVSFHQDQLMDIIAAADYLQMTELKHICLDELQQILTTDNVLVWWVKASMCIVNDVIDLCENIMASNIVPISHTAEFLSLTPARIELYASYIYDDSTQADDLLEAVMRWISYDTENRLPCLVNMLNHIDLNKCSTETFKHILETYSKDHQLVASSFQRLAMLNGSVTDKRHCRKTNELLIVGGDCKGTSTSVSPTVWNISKSQTINKLCDVTYEGFSVKHSVCKTQEGSFIFTGGEGSVTCMMYNTLIQAWRRLPDMLAVRDCHSSICLKNTIYVFGGYRGRSPQTYSPSVDMLQIDDHGWQKGPDLPLKVKFPKVAELEGSIYLLNEMTNQLLHMDEKNNKWNQRAGLPWKHIHCHAVCMTAARGRLYVAGGYYNMCAFYRPCTDTWCYIQPTLQKHLYGTIVHHSNKLILLGGDFNNGTDEVEEYNFENGTWSLCGYQIPAGLRNHVAMVLPVSTTSP